MQRRTFLAAAASASAFQAARADGKKPELCIFSKHMAQFNYGDLGKEAKRLGFDGVDLTVRPQGHVLPEKAAVDMPRAVEAIRSHGLTVPMITTNLLSATEPPARPTLSTAARLRIPRWKIGYYRYRAGQVEKDLQAAAKATHDLVALSKEFGLEAGFHNHSGDSVGAAVWDIREILRDLDPKYSGFYFDPAHATIEGGLGGWKLSQEIALPRLKMVALKDFYWKKTEKGWKTEWCPIGEGMVDWVTVFTRFAKAGYTGPMSLHIEYHAADELAAIGRDLEYIRKLVEKTYTA